MNYKISIPKKEIELENILDRMIKEPYVILPNINNSRHLGQYIKPLEKQKICGIYRNELLRESIVVLKNKNVQKTSNGRTKRFDYIFDIPSPRQLIKLL
jgi:hypothetical protein